MYGLTRRDIFVSGEGFAAGYLKYVTLREELEVPPTVAVATTESFALGVLTTSTRAA